ncbi:MAG: CDP-glycerol:glycerophosphate glycerophosphotransferase [Eubacterium sp.]|nr:CDP-glycerol:glycerophosphate glycerophosphotransferase [Eubacterium sp.]
MKVSIIIPYRNEMSMLVDCIDSLREQSVGDFEAVIVCAKSSHDDIDEIKRMQTEFPLHVYSLPEDRDGVAAARNFGIEKAMGEFVLFLDCDDYLTLDAFEHFLGSSEGKDIVYAGRKYTWQGRKGYYNEKRKKLEERGLEEAVSDDDEDFDKDIFLREMPEKSDNDEDWENVFSPIINSNSMITGITSLGILFRRALIMEKGIRFDESYIYNSDLTFITKMMCDTKNVIRIRLTLYIKRHHQDPVNMPALCQIEDSLTRLHEVMRAYMEMKQILAPVGSELTENYLDGKFIKYYVRRIAPYYMRGEKKQIPGVYEQASKCLPLIKEPALKRCMRYSKRLIKYSMEHEASEIAKKVRSHARWQTFKRTFHNWERIKHYFYRKKYATAPIEQNLIMFESFFGRNYSDSPRYIFEYLNKNYPGKYSYVWVHAKGKKLDLPYPARQVKRGSVSYLKELGRARFFVMNVRQPKFFIKREGTTFLETWHGTPLKRLVFDQDEVVFASPLYKKNFWMQAKQWDYLIAPNKFSSDIFRHCFMYDGNMLDTGYPRNDILHLEAKESEALSSQIKAELGIPAGKKVILYAPTWRDDEKLAAGEYAFSMQLDLDRMRERLSDEYVIVLRMHYLIVDAIDFTKYQGFAYNGSVYDDIARLYLISDILITDYSSVFFDYANLRRPMLFFTYDLDKYAGELRGFYFDMKEEIPGPMLFTTDEVIDAIENIPAIEDKYKEKYDAFYEKFCGWETGESSKKVVEEMISASLETVISEK